MNELQIFENKEFGQVRGTEVNGIPYVMLNDICEILELTNVSQVKSRLNLDGVIINEVTDILGRKQNANFISESNLYRVIFQSRKPNAEKFTDWVTADVLPSIRKTGAYKIPLTKKEEMKLYLEVLEEQDAKIEAVNKDLQDFKLDMPLLGLECSKITIAVHKKGIECLGGKDSSAYQEKSLRGKVYSDIHRQLKREFEVFSYKAIKRNQTDLAVNIINLYKAPFALNEQIKQCNNQITI